LLKVADGEPKCLGLIRLIGEGAGKRLAKKSQAAATKPAVLQPLPFKSQLPPLLAEDAMNAFNECR
jgi:hypothetical protein